MYFFDNINRVVSVYEKLITRTRKLKAKHESKIAKMEDAIKFRNGEVRRAEHLISKFEEFIPSEESSTAN